jgi:hypothetical protein
VRQARLVRASVMGVMSAVRGWLDVVAGGFQRGVPLFGCSSQ